MWMYFLHVCVSIKIHCLLNTGLLPTCRNVYTHTPHAHAHTRTHTYTRRHDLASQAVMPNLQVRLTERIGVQHLGSHLTGGHTGPGRRHMPALTKRPAHGPALHRTWLQPRIRPLSSRPLRLRLRHSGGWEEGKNEWIVKPRNAPQHSVAVGILQLPCRCT